MNDHAQLSAFENEVKKKFDVYNSLFLNLPFRPVSNVGMLIPLLQHVCKQGLDSGRDPLGILDSFFSVHTDITTEEEKIKFMFHVIRYVERQVVLYDSVEDAAFEQLVQLDDHLSLKDTVTLLAGNQKTCSLSNDLFCFSARLVFTARPTQFYSPSVLDIIGNLKSMITRNEINQIDLKLQQLGLTSLINARKPTPFDEARNIIYFLRHVYYDAVGELYATVKKIVRDSCFDCPAIIQLGFWPGGDRDGNPFVTAAITNDVADELRMNLMKCYYNDVKQLARKLTFKKVEDVLENLRARLYVAMFDPTKTMPYEEIMDPLVDIRAALIENYNSLYLDELDTLIDKVNIFRTHFATLDIRQNHGVHRQTVEAILKQEKLIANRLDELGKAELLTILLNREIVVQPDQFDDAIIKDTIETIAQMAHIQRKNGTEGCNRYVISHAEDIFSVLFVFSLLRWCGWKKGELPVDIIPLFESMEGMKNAGSIMQELFDIPQYRTHIVQRRNRQIIMLGFSDGTKDGGYLQANWSIYTTKETLSAVCDEHGIQAIFFDGRGGPPARGGGKTHRFYASHGKNIANHAIQLTIQGQTITSMYGTKAHFKHNCEQLLAAGLSTRLFETENEISAQHRQLIEKLAQLSFEKYTALKNHDMFIPYLENKSTLKYYGKTNIGSRPDKRGDKEQLDLEDLRAIPFVGSWSQLKQNVPGYYGVGTALQALVAEGKTDQLKQLFHGVPFFKALILNSMMALSKCYFELTAYIAEDDAYHDFWNMLLDEYRLSKEMVLMISGYRVLMEEEPVSKKSIEIRERIVLPLLVIQQYALQKIERKSKHQPFYEKLVERSLYGNINASRNSA
ncbi:Phosphoenolpyruvate carboxylase (EC [Olavius algarvensis associated proteobacterium Delta 3]|nr:Phosphoenolpyruvate carboxylase (EC [Olavius algarvensis associated proteobacterium Delta 3]